MTVVIPEIEVHDITHLDFDVPQMCEGGKVWHKNHGTTDEATKLMIIEFPCCKHPDTMYSCDGCLDATLNDARPLIWTCQYCNGPILSIRDCVKDVIDL